MIVGAAVLLTGAVAYRVFAGTSPATSSSATLLASTAGQARGETVDGISCQTSEQVVYHIHAELMVFVAGESRVIPEGIGIVGCFYWLHSHTRDGIIHIESPVDRIYSLGNYFDIWKQPLSTTQVGPATGAVNAYVNGVRFSGDPRSIPLTPHAIIQLNVGSEVPAHTFTFGCPGLASSMQSLVRPVVPPNMHLPEDPCLTSTTANCSGVWSVPEASISVAGTQMLQPTRSSIPGGPIGPRYSVVDVTSGATLYLQPGVYYFEGSVASSGLNIHSGGTVATGECYGGVIPGGCVKTNRSICGAALTYAGIATPGAPAAYPCPANNDWGVLLVFWPSGTDAACTEKQYPTASGNYYCDQTTTPNTGGLNTLSVQGSSTLYISSSSMYHNVAMYVNPHHSQGTSNNYTLTAGLSAAFLGYCGANFASTAACMAKTGNGSTVINVTGGSNTSIVGALFAPQDNSYLGGGSGGKGYGQILNYFIHFQGSGAINEAYNPLALAYSPVIVQ